MKRVVKAVTAAGLVMMLGTAAANAGSIIGGSLLDQAGADQLENWLGIGDQDFTNVWTGSARVSTATDFHSSVDGAGPTFSIFGITLSDGTKARIGGYTSLDWGGPSGYQYDSTAFIFNLDTLEVQFDQNHPQYAIYRNANYFSTFGGGHDIFAGYGSLGTCNGYNSHTCDGYSYSHSYDPAQGQISVANDSGYYSGDSGLAYWHWSVDSLEVYTLSDATSVPEPGTIALLGLGLAGMGVRRRMRA